MKADRLWYKNTLFYEVYVRAFYDSNGDGHGDLRGLIEKLDYLQWLGVGCLWLLPIYPSPLKDDGYDIADFTSILPEYGTPDDFQELLDAAHQRGMRVIADLVLNHTSDEHPWFQAARQSRQSATRDYYVWSDSDKKYQDARIIFLDSEPSNWTLDEATGQYYWHRFYASQPDLNYDNPAVQEEMYNVMRYWLGRGVDGFRADAVPYLFEREGTNCENLPETHAYLKSLRSVLERDYPGKILLCEANQWPEDVRPYFGDGDEFHMGFHFPVMPRLYMALRKGEAAPIRWIMDRTPEIPADCQWATFLRNHDELTLEMVTEEERQWMWQEYAPEARMRLNLGIRRRLAPLMDNDRRRIELMNSLLLSMPGSPVLYYGDEIGMGDNIQLFDRNGVRTPMQWSNGENGGFSSAPTSKLYAPVIESSEYSPQRVNVDSQMKDPHSLLLTIRHMIATRKKHACFGWGSLEWIETSHPGILAFTRRYQEQAVLVVHNLTGEVVQVQLPPKLLENTVDLLSGQHLSAAGNGVLEMQPYQYFWLIK